MFDVATVEITVEPRHVVTPKDERGVTLHTKKREFENNDAAEAYAAFLRGETLLQAHECESHGTYWEISTTDNRWVATVDTREEAAKWGVTEFHTLAEWYASEAFREAQEEARVEERLGLTEDDFDEDGVASL